ncbi:ribonucleotide reductase subunit alpha [Massilia scottii]|uniref:ribonucleotide reductase subunit alpha n=1 Tax=Massilia scottii TaxID=3057166 RepID=UPI002796D9D0|nr:ribonucleotide reductase subunit alpha [Massilia sp. CCM 9029]MDQ1829403.1 ribonucleotide reductase subunit alpha [Massilia sp. CCM 9029]
MDTVYMRYPNMNLKEQTMNITSYDDLIQAARTQPQPQRLLFAFARAELPDDAGAAERAGFAEQRGGALAPVMCVDKTAAELGSFADLVAESKHTGKEWDIVFVTTMSGRNGQPPASAEAEAPLNMMVTYIHTGQIGRFLAFGRDGELKQLAQ